MYVCLALRLILPQSQFQWQQQLCDEARCDAWATSCELWGVVIAPAVEVTGSRSRLLKAEQEEVKKTKNRKIKKETNYR